MAREVKVVALESSSSDRHGESSRSQQLRYQRQPPRLRCLHAAHGAGKPHLADFTKHYYNYYYHTARLVVDVAVLFSVTD